MSIAQMPFPVFPSTPLSPDELSRRVGRRLFGAFVHTVREARGLSLGDAARLAGVSLSEWMAIEDGHVPRDPERLSALAAALELDWHRVLEVAVFCRQAWDP